MMDNKEAVLVSQSDSTSVTNATKCHNANALSAKEDMLLQHLQRGISETTEENIAYTKEITNLLSKLNLEIKSLPNDIKESLEKVSMILKSEKLLEFDEVALRVARERKIIEEKKQQRDETQLSTTYDKLLGNCARMKTKLDYLQSEVNSLENTIDTITKDKNNLYCDKVFLSTKLEEYKQFVGKLEADLCKMHVDEFYSDKILDKYKLYLEKTSELTDLNQSLAVYGDLPPNLLQAKLLLESKRKEYETLENMSLEKN